VLDVKKFVENSLKDIRKLVGERKVISACSGGVDSTVTTVLVHKAVGDKLVAVFIDDGLRREGEPEFVVRTLKSLGIKTKFIDAKEEFFAVFKGKTDAEEKRKAFRDKFYKTLGKAAKEEQIEFIAQGTISLRVLGEVTPEKVAVVRKATEIVEEETKKLGTFQNFAVLHNDKATGIKEGKRVYGNIVTVRIVDSEDAVTAKARQVPYEVLMRISERITGEIPSVVRCLYDITDKPPSTIEFE
jgi:GMP synthase PP-ATPase subunit